MKRGVFFLFIILFSFSVYAADISIDVPRSEYDVHETFQAELNLNFTPKDDLTLNNFALYKEGERILTTIYFEKFSKTNYYVYFEIP
ncbi:hypothetical protein K8R47_00945, partial [archaeon]|nr:hypothetical protein [archaeon]